MKLHQSSALTNVGGSQTSAAAATNQEQPRDKTQTGKKSSSQGALQLAAIVHYDSLASYCPATTSASASTGERSCSRATSAASSRVGANNKSHVVSLSPPDRLHECDTKSGAQQAANTHEESGARVASLEKSRSSGGSKFSRLFFTKNKSKQQLPAMIDNHDDDDDGSPHPAPKPLSSAGHPGEGVRSGAAAAAAMSQVIEFKFDLIVEGERRDETPQKVDDDDNDELPSHSLATKTTSNHRKILRPIQQRKLLDQVNELVESFVLDSMDVCLMTVGRASSEQTTTTTFEYLLQSAELSLTYAFQLLAAVGPRGTASSRRAPATATVCSPMRRDAHSIELEALLFEERRHAREPLQVVDLSVNFARDCSTVWQAMDLIKQIEARLSGQKSATTLMINLKLKQQVQGGLFTNRMCLLDLGEQPGSSQLRPVLESIFSGQALAYLKAQKVQLHELEAAVATSGRASKNETGDEQNNKHHHHNAYSQQQQQQLSRLTKLNQAEWLVYKQLSSALIKSLMIVHCRRLAPSPATGTEHAKKSIEAQLMEYNLNLLEFASAIKRASASRLKRRKRHLRSHLANQTTGSNLSLASDVRPNYHYESSPSGNHHQHHHHDLMISSPFRRHAKTMAHRHHHQQRPCCESPPPPAQLPVLSAHLIDRYNQSYSHSRRRHRHKHNDHRKRHQHDSSGGCHKCSRHAAASRAASLNRRRSHDLLGVGAPPSLSSSLCRHCDELETSSQISTSSGSQRTSSAARRQLLVTSEGRSAMDLDLDDLDDSLATTTLHSGGHRRSGSTSIRDTALVPAASSVASWAARARRQLQQRALDLQRSSPSEQSAGGTLDDSIELQSFRSTSSSGVTATLAQAGAGAHLLCPRTGGSGLQQQQPDDLIPDPPSPLEAAADESDLGHRPPVVAEPPRQLKLEKFLNQLTSAIGGGGQLPGADLAHKQNSRHLQADDEDEDEDCRSHSSILEHLSSLALESNLKQHRVRAPTESRVSIVGSNQSAGDQTNPRWPLESANGHLQQLLKSTLKLHQQSQQQQQQSPLTIDCNAVHSMSSESNATQPAALSDSPRRSIESGCSSSGASSSSTSSGRRHALGELEQQQQQQQCLASKTAAANLNTQLYTSVIRQNT